MADVIFLAMMVVTVGGALVAMEADEIVYGAIGLAGSLFGVAALFFLLDAPYVAVFQITVYVGAVAVLILFTVMLVRTEKWAKEVPAKSLTELSGVLTGLAVIISLALTVVASNLSGDTTLQNGATFLDIGKLISTDFAPVLEILAMVLAAAIVGALTLSRVDREEERSA
ncbi:MAG TPA: NADH-quinone oxidoreductase subunit J [Nitrososphaerales archaeon]|nr:NADH-quinone oxidoreductase subunit J [Nitrososphaerales archaeon]